MSVTEEPDFLNELERIPYKKWYQFGFRSPEVLYKRLNWHPLFRAHMRWQRSQRGWSVEDTWGLSGHLARVIAGSVEQLIEELHGYPETGHWDDEQDKYVEGPLTFEGWKQILQEIVDGMRVAERHFDTYYTEEWEQGGEEKFNLAMEHLKEWWFALWD